MKCWRKDSNLHFADFKSAASAWLGYASSAVRIAPALASDCGNPARPPLVLFAKRAAREEAAVQHRQDDSPGVLDWVELADAVFDMSGFVLDVAIDAASGAFEVVGALFSLLDAF